MGNPVSDWPDNPRCPDGPPIELIRRALNDVLQGNRLSEAVIALYDFLDFAHISDNVEYFALRLPEDLETALPDEQVVRFLRNPSDSTSDDDRAAFIRHAIKNALTVPEGLQSAHWVRITVRDDLSFCLGCLVDGQSEPGPALYWQGGFATRADFYAHLREQDHVLTPNDIDDWSDAKLLAPWKTVALSGPANLH